MTSPLQPQKDFVALSHGQEWVTFYESFDLLVQDHLSRSSDLLRRAMSLPEVADREVAQVRDALEGQLSAEREQTSMLLTDLKTQIGNSHRLASTMAMSIGSLMTDLHALTQRVEEALQTTASLAAASPTSATANPGTGHLAHPGTGALTHPGTGTLTNPGTGNLSTPGTGALTYPGTGILSTPGTGGLARPGTGSLLNQGDTAPALDADDMPSIAEAVADVDDEADGGEPQGEPAIDLTAIAQAEDGSEGQGTDEEVGAEEGGQPAADGESSADPAERQRPHWLSVTRVGASRP